MARLTKKQKEAYAKLDNTKALDINAASALIKEITNVKFYICISEHLKTTLCKLL